MRYSVLFLAAVISLASCIKADCPRPVPPPAKPLSIANTSWLVAGNTESRYSFTDNEVVYYLPEQSLTPTARVYRLNHDTLYIYQDMSAYKFNLSKDSLILREVRTDQVLRLFRSGM